MNILILNTSERTGGAAVAANRLCVALNKQPNVQAKMLVRDLAENDSMAATINTSWWKKKLNFFRFVWERAVIFLLSGFDRKNLFSVSIANTGTDLSRHPLVKEADVIHLHWINQGFLSVSDIKKLIAIGKPIVWTMHDMWPAIGYYHHYPKAEEGNKEDGKDGINKLNLYGISHKRLQQIDYSKIAFVGCSHWIAEQANTCQLMRTIPISIIPNAINTKAFYPIHKDKAKKELNLPTNKPLILFAAVNISNKKKGIDYLVECCNNIKEDFEILLIGTKGTEIPALFSQRTHSLGYISNTEMLNKIYSSADLFITPSLEENLPNTIMEAMACGTPSVGFEIGGIPEMIDHKRNGYLAKYKDAEDLARGIEWVLAQDSESLKAACLEKVNRCYTEEVVARQYLELYRSKSK